MTTPYPASHRKTISDIRKKLYGARKLAGTICPYFYRTLVGMPVIITAEVPVMAVDKVGRLYVNEERCSTRSKADLAAIMIHEVYHLALSHAKRREDWMGGMPTEDQCRLWNIAADLAVNQLLARDTTLPDDALQLSSHLPDFECSFEDIPMVRSGLTTEAYVGLLAPYFRKKKAPEAEDEQEGDDGDEGEDGVTDEDRDDGQPGPKKKGKKKSGGGTGSGDDQPDNDSKGPNNDPDMEGSASDGVPKPWEKPCKMSDIARQVQQLEEIEKAIQSTPGRGAGTLAAAISARLRPQPDPFQQLRTFAARSVASPIGTDELTYKKLSRRQDPDGPRKRGVTRVSPQCSIIVDTSGSMSSGDNIQRALVALAAGLRQVQRPKVTCFDARMQARKEVQSLKNFVWQGGGGTDMGLAVTTVDKEDRPDAIVVLTDGETGWCDKPRARVIIALTEECRGYPTPAWAKVVHLYRNGGGYAG